MTVEVIQEDVLVTSKNGVELDLQLTDAVAVIDLDFKLLEVNYFKDVTASKGVVVTVTLLKRHVPRKVPIKKIKEAPLQSK